VPDESASTSKRLPVMLTISGGDGKEVGDLVAER